MKTIHVNSGPETWIAFAALLLGALFLWGALRLMLRFAHRKRRVNPCRWKREGRKDGPTLEAYICETCAEHAYSSTGKAPANCARSLSARAL